MSSTKGKRCCVPYCPNIQGINKKQFFRIGANLEARNKLRIGKLINPKSALMHCCEDHFDLPNDALNYIRFKYQPGTKLKLRKNLIPHRRLPVNVCRLCLNLIYNEDDLVDISKKKGADNAKVVNALLPEVDLSITVEPVVCIKCFRPLEQYYNIKQNVLKNEMVVVNCIKAIVQRSPKRFMKNCEIDLFDEYNDINGLLKKDNETNEDIEQTESEENIEKLEEIVIQLEEEKEEKYNASENSDIQETEEENISFE